MKKGMLFLLTVLLAMSFFHVSFAEDETAEINNDLFSEIPGTKLSEEEQAVLFDRSNYEKGLEDIFLEDKPILTWYFLYWDYADKSLPEMIKHGQEAERVIYYIVLGEEITYLYRAKHDDGVKIGLLRYEGPENPTYISDLLSCENKVYTINGTEHTVINVVCFNSNSGHDGILMYYETLDGTFVRYYQDEYSKAVDYTIDQFQIYAAGYYEYKLSHPAVDKDGNVLIGKVISFADYVNSLPETPDTAQLTTPENTNPIFLFYVIGAAVAAAIILVFVCVMLRRKRKSA